MPTFITNITTALTEINTSLAALFTVIALTVFFIVGAIAFFSPEARKMAWMSKLMIAIGVCVVFGAASTLITWALGIG